MVDPLVSSAYLFFCVSVFLCFSSPPHGGAHPWARSGVAVVWERLIVSLWLKRGLDVSVVSPGGGLYGLGVGIAFV